MPRIVAVIVDQKNLTLYKDDGNTIVIAQGDPRIRGLVERVVPAVEKDKYYDLTEQDLSLNPDGQKHYAEAELATNGVVRFFRLAKKKLQEIAAKFREPVAPISVGDLPPVGSALAELVPEPEADEEDPALPVEEERPELTRGQAACAEIIANAASTSDTGFHRVPDIEAEEEMVTIAIVDGETVIPDVDMIDVQLRAVAAKLGSAEGVANFFRRLATVKRDHTVADLLTFMEKGELPIADDGTVLVYKLLNSHGQGDSLYFTDVHSGQVKQKVGSRVFMAESLVDRNRDRDCSNGLHIARRDYLNAFSGNACMLCKLAPEDVIAVPHSDARKLRCKGYFIVAQLSDKDRALVKQDKAMSDTVLLGNVAAGNHVEVLETVEITKQNGGGLIITPTGANKQAEVVKDENLKAESLDTLDTNKPENARVDAREIALGKVTAPPGGENVVEPTGVTAEPIPLVSAVVPGFSRRPADLLIEAYHSKPEGSYEKYQAAYALLLYKKQCKKSWTALGVAISVWDPATKLVDAGPPAEPVEEKPAPKAKRTENVATAKGSIAAQPKLQQKSAKGKPVATPTKTAAKPKVNQVEHVAGLVEVFLRVPCKSNAMAIVNYKRNSKKSWDVLNVKADLVKRLMNYDK